MRDMWAAAPGADRATIRAQRRSKFKAGLAATLVMTLGIGGLVYASMRTSTAVSTEDALAEFRADKSRIEKERARERSAAVPTKGKDQRKSPRSAPARAASSGNGGGSVAAGTDSQTTAEVERTGSAPATTRRGSVPARPADGVYTWNIEGYEQAPGVRRDLPRRSHRIITYEGDNAWQEHHIFSEQKEQWFDLQISRAGVATTAVRNRVEMGPVTVDRTVTYNPPCFVSRFPVRVGQTWEGSWSGKTSGTYVAKTFERTTLTIGGEQVDVYGTEVIMDLTGEVEGRVVTRSWVAPHYSLVVKQYQESKVRSGPGDYYSEWSGQVTSLHPQR
ncbi:MAG: hypothetical protein ACRDKT_04505 [Actinomycetota bacterium]